MASFLSTAGKASAEAGVAEELLEAVDAAAWKQPSPRVSYTALLDFIDQDMIEEVNTPPAMSMPLGSLYSVYRLAVGMRWVSHQSFGSIDK
jgi:hypothetical protein